MARRRTMLTQRFLNGLGVLLALSLLAAPGSVRASDFDHSYRDWTGLLRSTVSGGLVDYAKAGQDPRLERFVAALGEVAPEEVAGWSRAQQLAFYVNAYNAITVQTIVEAMPIASIRDIKPNAWDNARWTVAGRTVSLDTIEHQKLRKDLREPRIHFVLVCAARSCPPLADRALLPSKLDEQLDAAGRAFFGDKRQNRINRTEGRVELSKILHWFGKDFVGWKGLSDIKVAAEISDVERAVVRMLGAYVGTEDREFLSSGSFAIVYNEYDWGLNGR